ncbi:MAG: MATE family efflux transporter [Rubrivivax sp.]|nr:MATE family efflux transporter [Rubrivivax sp.]
MLLTVAVGIAETWYIGRLGTTPLAAMALVFPFAMLTQMLSAGAMGGGVSSAIARALGAGDTARARTLAMHALAIGAGAGVLYSVLLLVLGPLLYRTLGGRGDVLAEAVRYAAVLFGGALLVWLMNTLASVLRGTGNMRVPSLGIAGAAVLQIVLGGVLGLGAGPVPSLGMAGVALGHLAAMAAGTAFFAWVLTRPGGRLPLDLHAAAWRALAWQREMFRDILRVGALACLSPLQSVLTAVIFTGLVARLGLAPLAGYGIGQRLEFLLVPIAFGIGVASVPMVGMAIGAGDVARARRVAWVAGAVSTGGLAVIGGVVAIAPDLWAALFTGEETVLASARSYLRIVGPAFPLFGLGLTLYFAAQGAGAVLGPVLAGTARLAVVLLGGAWLLAGVPSIQGLFALAAGGMAVYGVATLLAVRATPWGAPAGGSPATPRSRPS